MPQRLLHEYASEAGSQQQGDSPSKVDQIPLTSTQAQAIPDPVPQGEYSHEEHKFDEFTSTFTSFNVRSIQDQRRQWAVSDISFNRLNADIVHFSETRASRKIWLGQKEDRISMFQSAYSREGGAASASRGWEARNIKYVGEEFVYSVLSRNRVRVHSIACYLSSKSAKSKHLRASKNHLYHVIVQILATDPSADIVVSGDFNAEHIDELDTVLPTLGLLPVFQDKTRNGSRLDEVYTNATVSEYSLVDPNLAQSHLTDDLKLNLDHLIMLVKFEWKTARDVSVPLTCQEISAACRRTGKSAHGQEQLKSWSIQQELREFLTVRGGIWKRQARWYRAPGPKVLTVPAKKVIGTILKETWSQHWTDQAIECEAALERHDHLLAGKIARKLAGTRKKGQLITGIVSNTEDQNGNSFQSIDCNPHSYIPLVADLFSQLYHIEGEQFEEIKFQADADFFTEDEIAQAIHDANFEKAVGPDGFDGAMAPEGSAIWKKVKKQITDALNSGEIPQYLSKGRMVLLSKDGGSTAEPSKTRPLVITSHLLKIMETAVLKKLDSA